MSWVAALERQAITTKATSQVADPPGFISLSKKSNKQIMSQSSSTTDRETLQVKKAWEIAIAPLKSLPMSAIMTWFSGSSIQIFSVMMTGSLFWTPLKVLFSNPFAVFTSLDNEATHDRLFFPKVVFVIGQLLSIALGLVKLQYMGLLPTTTSDWLAWETYVPVCLLVPVNKVDD
ncbi:Putative uncharacterized protein [Taphrina deformans PYCC 5710]|uniref:ER membrane protein complex subunit 4 n=1 Tax=Taphrina deformans (strain PYCC 5710 / ATCC 11124 / CBS 356.35 / IMI 108563 / JCM 9778 / NBRC 8474) TaxID=1097556 RepID=R4X7B2_TAPDE|nr:Putative uncharacterized protein [Taphrina deformans PYCC 5710]|eukprot:CCG80963.1 Putative uncharacterized protein [Taphrina deformans PYCC 5710]